MAGILHGIPNSKHFSWTEPNIHQRIPPNYPLFVMRLVHERFDFWTGSQRLFSMSYKDGHLEFLVLSKELWARSRGQSVFLVCATAWCISILFEQMALEGTLSEVTPNSEIVKLLEKLIAPRFKNIFTFASRAYHTNSRWPPISVGLTSKRCRGERRLHDRNELWVPFGMQNFTSCVAHAYACVASENQALQLVYPFSSKGNATSEILHTKCTHSSFRSCNLRSPRQRFLK